MQKQHAWLWPMDTSASKWVILTVSSCVLMGYVYVYDSTKTNTEHTENAMLPWCTGATEGALKTLLWQCPSAMPHTLSKNQRISVKWCWKHKTTGLKVNEFKLRESFDHFMLLVMRTYIMRTQYERKSVCFSKLSSAVLGRTHQTFLAPFIRSA